MNQKPNNFIEMLELLKSRISENSDIESSLSNLIESGVFSKMDAWQISTLIRLRKGVEITTPITLIERAIYFLTKPYKTSRDYEKLWQYIIDDDKKVIVFVNNTHRPEIGVCFHVYSKKDQEHLFQIRSNEKEYCFGEGFYYFNQHCMDLLLEFIEPTL